jgi:hypothetical protein
MSIHMKYAFNLIALISGLVTIITLFVAPSTLSKYITLSFPHVNSIVGKMLQYAWYIILIPVFCGIHASRKQNGFTRLSPKHIAASIMIYPFWLGVGKGTKVIGLISFVIFGLIILQRQF